jgi:hypothetical protein
MAETNQVAQQYGTEPIYDANEIRKAGGYEEREGGGDGFKEDDPDPATLPGDPAVKPMPKP